MAEKLIEIIQTPTNELHPDALDKYSLESKRVALLNNELLEQAKRQNYDGLMAFEDDDNQQKTIHGTVTRQDFIIEKLKSFKLAPGSYVFNSDNPEKAILVKVSSSGYFQWEEQSRQSLPNAQQEGDKLSKKKQATRKAKNSRARQNFINQTLHDMHLMPGSYKFMTEIPGNIIHVKIYSLGEITVDETFSNDNHSRDMSNATKNYELIMLPSKNLKLGQSRKQSISKKLLRMGLLPGQYTFQPDIPDNTIHVIVDRNRAIKWIERPKA